MIAGLAILLLASSNYSAAQANSLGAPGCGRADVKWDVKTESGHHPVPPAEPGKVMIVFLQDDSEFDANPRPTTKFGIDGAWVGATHANSYFYVSVDPGEHHLCASWQTPVSAGPTQSTVAMHFTAEAGQTYYFVARDYTKPSHSLTEVLLEPVDSDEGELLANSFEFSTSHATK